METDNKEKFSELEQFELNPSSMRLLPRPFCERQAVVILGKVESDMDKAVTLGMLNPKDEAVRLQIADMLERPVEAVRLNRYEIEKAIEVGFGAGTGAGEDLVISSKPLEPDPTAVAMVDYILATAVERKASDIHIETYFEDVDLRYRVDGILHQIYTDMNPNMIQEVTSRIKVLANLDITERRVAQDGRIRCTIVGPNYQRKTVDLRISVVPGPAGEDVVIRVLDPGIGLIPVEGLGMSPEVSQVFLKLLANPEGLILVTGPTGSGKTTTLYAALAQMNDGRRKVLTVEDPIEYYISKVNQKEVTPKMTMHDLLRALLRQDPDVMLVGEIRDPETGSTALAAAATGHVVMGTVHTSGAIGAVGRLRGLGLDDSDIAHSLLGVLSQRLARRVCPDCVKPIEPSEEQKRLLGSLIEGIPLVAGRGCEACLHTGYRGRIAFFELLVVDEQMQEMIAEGAHALALKRHAHKQGFRPLVDDALGKIKTGLTTPDELIRVVPYRQLVQMTAVRAG
jgi:type II secretory ATPase GspE/PulE/Tfp pilus assembly ATPase PilB-like protein